MKARTQCESTVAYDEQISDKGDKEASKLLDIHQGRGQYRACMTPSFSLCFQSLRLHEGSATLSAFRRTPGPNVQLKCRNKAHHDAKICSQPMLYANSCNSMQAS